MALDALFSGTRRIAWWRSAAKLWHECNRPCCDSDGQTGFIALPGLDSSRLVCLRSDRPGKASAATAAFRELFPLARARKLLFHPRFSMGPSILSQKNGESPGYLAPVPDAKGEDILRKINNARAALGMQEVATESQHKQTRQ